MICKNCGAEVSAKFCPKCGTPVTVEEPVVQEAQNVEPVKEVQTAPQPPKDAFETPQPNFQQQAYQQQAGPTFASGFPVFGLVNTGGLVLPSQYQPLSMWGYAGYTFLFSIPCIGLILAFVLAFGGASNENLKNYARGYLLYLGILCLFGFLFWLWGILTVASMFS